MTVLFKKLNFKDHQAITVLNAPDNFNGELQAMQEFAQVQTAISPGTTSALAFALTQAQVDVIAQAYAENSEGDAVLWIAYPKGSSKRYKCDFNRDTGWEVMGKLGFEPVRMVAIDEDWSALRFRRIDFIKTMTRSFAMSEEGKKKADSAPVSLVPPDDLLAAFEQSPAALAFFEKLAPSHKKEYIRWITEAKRPETRASRVEKTIEMLTAGKKMR